MIKKNQLGYEKYKNIPINDKYDVDFFFIKTIYTSNSN